MRKNTQSKNGLTIGKLAREAGVGVETIRYYQRRALLELPRKPRHRQRRYPLQALARLRFIKRAQAVGFTLNEVAMLLALGRSHCQDVQSLVQAKLAMLKEQIAHLEEMRGRLQDMITECNCHPTDDCGFIRVLAEEDVRPGKPE